jgi:hypothetical protein
MPLKKKFDLSAIDGQLLDGLVFCRIVYGLFDQIRSGPGGIEKLRLRPTKNEKRLLEELIPIARYVQARYREGRRIKVRWFGGSQPYDALLWSSGSLVTHRLAPKKSIIEVTTSVHQNDYLKRQRLHQQGVAFGVKGLSRDKKTGVILSEPYAEGAGATAADLAARILERIKSKSAKSYWPARVLIVNCVPDGVLFEEDWQKALDQVAKAQEHMAFREVFLIASPMVDAKTLFGNPKRRKMSGGSQRPR